MIAQVFTLIFLFTFLGGNLMASESIPSRETLIQSLQEEEFDILIIGGGATGAGVALDAVSRGLKVALVETADFSSGTSSFSTKLLHGGVRYLEKAIKEFDFSQLKFVYEGLEERGILMQIAPHLSHRIELVTPVYSFWESPYYSLGLKLYEWMGGKKNLGSSSTLSKEVVLSSFPLLDSTRLKGGVRYYDGQFNDARMNISLILTAIKHGACALNYIEVRRFKKENSQIVEAEVYDHYKKKSFFVRAKHFVNATGPGVDTIRKMDQEEVENFIIPSSGSHLLLRQKLCVENKGLLIPKTKDGRVIFILPWEQGTLVGTTDRACSLDDSLCTEEEKVYLLEHIQAYFSYPFTKDDILATWSGIRPLVRDIKNKDTKSLSREHLIHRSESGLWTIAGGKWTSYRRMAEDLLDTLSETEGLEMGECKTKRLLLIGTEGYHLDLAQELRDEYKLDIDVAYYLASAYGGNAKEVVKLGTTRLFTEYPYLESEVQYSMQNECACYPIDILARRMRIAFLDYETSRKVLPKVFSLMQKEGVDLRSVSIDENELQRYR